MQKLTSILKWTGAVIGAGFVMFLITFYLSGGMPLGKSSANPPVSMATSTASATSTRRYMTGGNSTSTLILDAGMDGSQFLGGSLSLLIQYDGSSTASVLNSAIQYSNDGIDWYYDSQMGTYANLTGSSSPSLANPMTIVFPFATSSQDQVNSTMNNASSSTRIAKDINWPTRYVRAVFSQAPGANGAFWAQMIGKKENR